MLTVEVCQFKQWEHQFLVSSRITRHLFRAGGPHAGLADDIAAETATRCIQAGVEVSRRRVIDTCRLASHRPMPTLGDQDGQLHTTPHDSTELRDTVEAIAAGLPSLRIRIWWRLVANEGLTPSEAARALGVSATTRQRWQAALRGVAASTLAS